MMSAESTTLSAKVSASKIPIGTEKLPVLVASLTPESVITIV